MCFFLFRSCHYSMFPTSSCPSCCYPRCICLGIFFKCPWCFCMNFSMEGYWILSYLSSFSCVLSSDHAKKYPSLKSYILDMSVGRVLICHAFKAWTKVMPACHVFHTWTKTMNYKILGGMWSYLKALSHEFCMLIFCFKTKPVLYRIIPLSNLTNCLAFLQST